MDIEDIEFQKNVYKHIGMYTKKSWFYSTYYTLITLLMLAFCFNSNHIHMVPIFAMVLIRTFIIFHDMGHDSFFPSSKFNWFFGLLFGTVTFTPLSYWVAGHTYHHVNANKINKDQHAQTAAWDSEKYLTSSRFSKFLYRLTYGKYTLFTLNPIIYFIILNRIGAKWYEMLLQLIYLYILYAYLDSSQYLYFILSVWVSAIIGFMLFHAQHTFDNGYRAHDGNKIGDWNYFKNGMLGSSFIQVPKILKIFTCNIQYHHIHHLNSKVPCYNLEQCHNDGAEYFKNVPKIYLIDILKSLKYSVYNVKNKSYDDVYDY